MDLFTFFENIFYFVNEQNPIFCLVIITQKKIQNLTWIPFDCIIFFKWYPNLYYIKVRLGHNQYLMRTLSGMGNYLWERYFDWKTDWPPCKRPCGAPRFTYGRALRKSLKKVGISTDTWTAQAMDRANWRNIINTLYIFFLCAVIWSGFG